MCGSLQLLTHDNGSAPHPVNPDDCAGHTLQPHVDDRQMSTGEIVTLSLLGTCTMTFETDGKKGGSQKVRVHLPPRTLQASPLRASLHSVGSLHQCSLSKT